MMDEKSIQALFEAAKAAMRESGANVPVDPYELHDLIKSVRGSRAYATQIEAQQDAVEATGLERAYALVEADLRAKGIAHVLVGVPCEVKASGARVYGRNQTIEGAVQRFCGRRKSVGGEPTPGKG